jgi:hypothetical protein
VAWIFLLTILLYALFVAGASGGDPCHTNTRPLGKVLVKERDQKRQRSTSAAFDFGLIGSCFEGQLSVQI